MTHIIHALGMTLLHFLWQGALVGIALWLLLFIVKRPQQRYVLACCSLLLLSILPVITYLNQPSTTIQPEIVEAAPSMATPAPTVAPALLLPVQDNSEPIAPLTLPENTAEQASIAPAEAPRAWWQGWELEPFLPYIVLAWLLGVLTFSLRLLGGYLWLRNLRARALEPANTALLEKLALLKQQLGIRLPVRLHHSDHVAVPMVMGIIKPIILLPSSSLMGLTMQQLETILAHELAHIQRHDYLVNMLQGICEALLFYHPVMWWVNRVIRHERELCCDDIAVRLTNQPKTYAHALSVLAHNSITTKTTTTMAKNLAPSATGGSMYQRIQRILKLPKQHSRPAIIGVISLALLAGLAFSLISAAQPQRTLHEQQKKPVLWVTFAGAINFDEDGFTVYSSPEQHSFFVIEEVTGQQRRFASDIVYDELRETRFNLTDLEPWLYEALNPVISHLPERSVTPVFSIRNRMQESSYDNYIIISYPTLQMSADYSDMWSRPGTVTSSDPDITIPQHILKIAQRSAHGLLNEDTVMHYLRNVATKHSRLWGNYPDTLEILIKTLTQAENRQEARALFGIADKAELEYLLALQPVDTNSADDEALWITVVGDITLQNDNLAFSYNQRHKPFIVVEERAGQKRIFDSRDNYSNDGEYALALTEFEPWLAQVLRDVFPKVLELQTKDHSSYLGNIASREVRLMVITKRSKSEDMLSLQPAVRSYEEIFAELDLNEAQYASLITTSFGDMAQRRQHGLLVDQEVMTYLRTVAKRHNPLPLGTQESLDLLINSMDSEIFREEARALFSNDNQSETEAATMWLAFAGDIRSDKTGFTVYSSPEQPAFFRLTELGGKGREVRSAMDYTHTRKTTFTFADFEPWEVTMVRAMLSRLKEVEGASDDLTMYAAFAQLQDGRVKITHAMAVPVLGTVDDPLQDMGIISYLKDLERNYYNELVELQPHIDALVDSIDDVEFRKAIRASFTGINQNPEEIWVTLAGKITLGVDTVTLHASSEPTFIVVEERGGRERIFQTNINSERTQEITLAFRDLEPWVGEALVEQADIIEQLKATSQSRSIYAPVYVDGTASTIKLLVVPDFSASEAIYNGYLLSAVFPPEMLEQVARDGFSEALQRKKHGLLDDAALVRYLREVHSKYDTIASLAPEELEQLLNSFEDEAIREEARAIFSQEPNAQQENPEALWVTVVGKVAFAEDSITIDSIPYRKSFFVVEERGGQERVYRSDEHYAHRGEITINFSELAPWVSDSLRALQPKIQATQQRNIPWSYSRILADELATLPYPSWLLVQSEARAFYIGALLYERADDVANFVDLARFSLTEIAQRKAHGLVDDGSLMTYLVELYKQHPDIAYRVPTELSQLVDTLNDEENRVKYRDLFGKAYSALPTQAQPDELWLSFAGDITFNEDSLTILASPQQKSSFTIEERGGLGRKISSSMDYSQASEQTIAFAELEPWASAYLHELQTVLHSTTTMLADDAMAFSTHQHIPSEWTHLPFDSYLFFSNYPQPLKGYTGVIFGTSPTEDTGNAEPSAIAKQSFRNAAQLRAHGLIDDAALLAYFAETAAHERMIPREAYGELELALSTFQSPSARQEAENVLQIILNPVIENIALTFAGAFTFQDDGVVIHYSQEKQSFFVIEESSGAQRKYISNQDYARANDYFLSYEALEPWARNILQDITPKLQQMAATISPTQPIKTAMNWGFSKQLRNYHNIDIIMNRNRNSLQGMHSVLTDMPDEDITLLDFVLAVRDDLKQINQQRSHGAIRDTEVMAYLQAAQSNYPQLALELQSDINSLNERLPPEAQTEVRELFTFIDTPLHTNSAAEIEELLLATFAGNISFQGDALTLHAAHASNEGAFLVLEEMGGRQRHYEHNNPTASDITIRVSDLPRWARAALREIIASLPAQPTGEQGRSFYSNQLGYRYQIFFTDRQLALTPYQDAWTRDTLGMDSHLIGAHKLFYKVMQYHKHGLLEDDDVMDYLRAITAKNGTILGLFRLELEHLTRNLAAEQREEAARLFNDTFPKP